MVPDQRNEAVQHSSARRRTVLRSLTGVAVGGTIAGCLDAIGASDDEYSDSFDDGNPEYGNWFDDVVTYDGTVDARGADEVAAGSHGGLAFDPAAVLIDPGTTVIWEWTGDGGRHDVVRVDGAFESERTRDAGHVFEHAFDEPGVYRYVCESHRRAGMKGAVAVAERA